MWLMDQPWSVTPLKDLCSLGVDYTHTAELVKECTFFQHPCKSVREALGKHNLFWLYSFCLRCMLLLIWINSFARLIFVFQCKCAQYWPDQGCWTYGNIRVSVEDSMVLVDYTIRKFCIQQVRYTSHWYRYHANIVTDVFLSTRLIPNVLQGKVYDHNHFQLYSCVSCSVNLALGFSTF